MLTFKKFNMKRILLLSFAMLFGLFGQTYAQERTVSGKVTAFEDNSPLPGVTVVLKEAGTGVSTDLDGNYKINVPASGGTLVFSFVGYTSEEVAIGNRSVVNMALTADIKQLSEVVVVGYGEQSRKELTGSVASVNTKELENLPLTSFEQTLQGRAAGIQVTQASGTPGAGISVRVRGATSLSGSNEPLYVVDGVPINTGNYSSIGTGGQQLNALADLNPNDIESIEVLKDAASASIYGSRAANGVVLITTKKGKKSEKTNINFGMFRGVQSAWKTLETISGPEYLDLLDESLANRFGPAFNRQALGTAAFPSLDNADYGNTNWFDEILRSAAIAQYDLSASGGSDKTRFLVSGTYFDQDGIVIGSNYNRFNARLNVENNASERLNIGTNIAVSRSTNNRIQNDNNINGVISTAILLGSHIPAFRPDGTYGRDPLSSIENPIAAALEPTLTAVTSRIIGNAYADYEFFPGFSFRSSWGIDFLNLKEDQFSPTTTNTGAGPRGVGNAVVNSDLNWVSDQTLNYRKSFGDHNISAVGGIQVQRSQFEGVIASATGFPGNSIIRLSAGSNKTNASSSGSGWGLFGVFTRVNYSFKGKYLLSGTFRRDGSSRFGANNRFGNFPGVSAGWLISEEDFMKGISVISNLKLRSSFGITGNAAIGNFASLGLIGVGANYFQQAGLAPTQLANPTLTWEQTQQFDIGLDIGLVDDRISLIVEYYNKFTDNFLQNLVVPSTSGFTSYSENVGAMRNTGMDITLITQNVRTRDFNWTTNFNISTVRNRVERLDGAPFAAGFANWVEEGYPIGSFRGFRTDGIFQTQEEVNAANAGSPTGVFISGLTRPGDFRFADLDGDGRITNDDQEILGDFWPRFFGGITNTISYKNFDLNFFFQGSYGNSVWNHTRVFSEGMNSIFGQTVGVRDRWTPDNPSNTMPRAVWGDPSNNRRNSDRWLEDGSYLRLKNLTFGYTLPKQIVERIGARNLRFYFASQNLLTFTNYSGLDPEVNTFSTSNLAVGTDFLTYPQARTLTLGLNLGL